MIYAEFSGKKLYQIAALSGFLLLGVNASALPTGEREIAHFEREALRCVREVFRQPGQFVGSDYQIELNNQPIHDTMIKRATITLNNISQRDLARLAANEFDFAQLQQTGSIEVDGLIEAGAIKTLINREVGRVPSGKQIFADIVVNLGQNRVSVSGKVDLQKIPGNPFTFFPQQMSTFAVEAGIKTESSQLILEIFDGEMNGQPLTPELKRMFHDWLNPLWDFAAMPYNASLNHLQISPAGIRFRGSLFK